MKEAASILRKRSPIYSDLSDADAITRAAVVDLFARDMQPDSDLSIAALIETIEQLIVAGA